MTSTSTSLSSSSPPPPAQAPVPPPQESSSSTTTTAITSLPSPSSFHNRHLQNLVTILQHQEAARVDLLAATKQLLAAYKREVEQLKVVQEENERLRADCAALECARDRVQADHLRLRDAYQRIVMSSSLTGGGGNDNDAKTELNTPKQTATLPIIKQQRSTVLITKTKMRMKMMPTMIKEGEEEEKMELPKEETPMIDTNGGMDTTPVTITDRSSIDATDDNDDDDVIDELQKEEEEEDQDQQSTTTPTLDNKTHHSTTIDDGDGCSSPNNHKTSITNDRCDDPMILEPSSQFDPSPSPGLSPPPPPAPVSTSHWSSTPLASTTTTTVPPPPPPSPPPPQPPQRAHQFVECKKLRFDTCHNCPSTILPLQKYTQCADCGVKLCRTCYHHLVGVVVPAVVVVPPRTNCDDHDTMDTGVKKNKMMNMMKMSTKLQSCIPQRISLTRLISSSSGTTDLVPQILRQCCERIEVAAAAAATSASTASTLNISTITATPTTTTTSTITTNPAIATLFYQSSISAANQMEAAKLFRKYISILDSATAATSGSSGSSSSEMMAITQLKLHKIEPQILCTFVCYLLSHLTEPLISDRSGGNGSNGNGNDVIYNDLARASDQTNNSERCRLLYRTLTRTSTSRSCSYSPAKCHTLAYMICHVKRVLKHLGGNSGIGCDRSGGGGGGKDSNMMMTITPTKNTVTSAAAVSSSPMIVPITSVAQSLFDAFFGGDSMLDHRTTTAAATALTTTRLSSKFERAKRIAIQKRIINALLEQSELFWKKVVESSSSSSSSTVVTGGTPTTVDNVTDDYDQHSLLSNISSTNVDNDDDNEATRKLLHRNHYHHHHRRRTSNYAQVLMSEQLRKSFYEKISHSMY